jgi:hypothetical protein
MGTEMGTEMGTVTGTVMTPPPGSVMVTTGAVEVAVVAVVVDVVVAHVGMLILFVSRLTCPFLARRRPWTCAPVFAVIEVSAMMVPIKLLFTPRVAELPTCQKTLQGVLAQPVVVTVEPVEVMSVDPVWKIQTAFGFP